MTDKENFKELFKLHSKDMRNYARGILKNSDDAKDAVNDVFERYMKTFNYYKGDCSIKTWLLVLTRNYCFKKLNGKANLLSSIEDDNELTIDENITLKITVDEALDRLKPDEYEIVYLKDYAGYSYNEISAIMELSVDNVKVKLFRVRQKLKKYLQ